MFFNDKIILLILFLDQKNDEKCNCLPCIYWPPKMHKIPSGARFIITGVRNVLMWN